ncbi:MAG: CvpA family protein [Patescibacteria group bacterium]
MQNLDYILLGILAIFTWVGFWSGFITSLGRFLGLFLGAALASRYYIVLAPEWEWVFFDNTTLTEIALFIIIFIVVSRGLGLVFWILDKIFDFIRFFPFLTTINRVLGGVLGLLEGVLVLGLVLFLLTKYPVSSDLIQSMNTSVVADVLLGMNFVIQPFLAEAFRNLPLVEIFK